MYYRRITSATTSQSSEEREYVGTVRDVQLNQSLAVVLTDSKATLHPIECTFTPYIYVIHSVIRIADLLSHPIPHSHYFYSLPMSPSLPQNTHTHTLTCTYTHTHTHTQLKKHIPSFSFPIHSITHISRSNENISRKRRGVIF